MKQLSKIEITEQVKDYSSILKDAYVSITDEISKQPVCISIGESHYKGSILPIAFGSYGDYSCIVGSSKSKKSFLKSAILAAYLSKDRVKYFDNIKSHYIENKYVFDIDTEQSKYHSQRVFKRVCDMLGFIPNNYMTYSLREYTPRERFEFIDWIFTKSVYKDKISLMSIDGYADLVSDFNNLEQSNELQEKLLNWSANGNCHITGILHKNFNSEKPVGHIGSSILKKAETVAFVEKEDDVTKVVCKYSRNIPFNDFKFRVNELWLPEIVGTSNIF